jgi:hypothetical protein
MKDELSFERALAEYRKSTGDLQDFADLPIEVQSEILRRAHHIKAELAVKRPMVPSHHHIH